MDLFLKLKKHYSQLSEAQQRIADYLIETPELFLESSSLQIGEETKTSSATVIRFAKVMGLTGLEALKRQTIHELSLRHPKETIDPIIEAHDNVESLCLKLNHLLVNAQRDLFYGLDRTSLLQAIDLCRNARRIYLVGTGASSLPAYDLYHKLQRINRVALFNLDSHMSTEFIHYATPEDVLIAFSYSGQSIEATYPAELAKDRGVPIIGVTRDKDSPLQTLSQIVLCVPNDESTLRVGAIASKFTTMIYADLLYLGIIIPDIERIEKDLISTGKITRRIKNVRQDGRNN